VTCCRRVKFFLNVKTCSDIANIVFNGSIF
jgi:hypothetical protein